MKNPPHELLEFLQRYSPSVQGLTLALRSVVHEELAPCHEYIFAMRSGVVLLYGATAKVMADGICMIGVHAGHVNLAFRHGTEMEDPAGLLQGTGTTMRHVKLKSFPDLERPPIRAYLRQARKRAGIRRPRQGKAEVVTRVKAKSPARADPSPPASW